ncbi:tRNA splicing endonuclease subunit SEN2 [Sporobolomyces salmoneus]|uniref:tRNA splicing endonuclease subunit SEN2 n=1 Tax=Sporobolomyces salmoneus TaxID=183962 RepID=UPI00316DEA68
MASTTTAPARGILTRPENLSSSNKRTSRQSLLALYSQLLPLAPPPPSYLSTFLSTLPGLGLTTPQIEAVWDELTQSIWVNREDDMQRLWRQGFFGKGFLSRSEPSWRRRVENRRAELEGREKRLTSEEITAQRRLERKGTKLVKKLERDAEKLLAASTAASTYGGSSAPSPSLVPTASTSLEGVPEEEVEVLKEKLEKIVEEREADTEEPTQGGIEEKDDTGQEEVEKEDPPEPWQLEAEHTQLQPEEAFFLLFSLGCLSLRISPLLPSTDSSPPLPRLSIISAFSLFLRSACPTIPTSLPPPTLDPRLNRLDSPFFLSYAAYHHYRSMGWVVRSGVKFCTDWVLYGPGGPVGGHAEFAVLIIPSYVNPRDSASSPFATNSTLAINQDPALREAYEEEREEHLRGEGERRNSWRWFHTVNRVCSGVKKTLVLLHVVIPDLEQSTPKERDWLMNHPAQALAKLQMREIVVRRFLAGRMRD